MPRSNNPWFIERLQALLQPSPRATYIDFEQDLQVVHEVHGPIFTQRVSATGSGSVMTVPELELWKVMTIRVTVNTDATVAARRIRVSADTGTLGLFLVTSASTQAASLSRGYNLFPGAPDTDVRVADYTMPMPIGLLLASGSRIVVTIDNVAAGDTCDLDVHYERRG